MAGAAIAIHDRSYIEKVRAVAIDRYCRSAGTAIPVLYRKGIITRSQVKEIGGGLENIIANAVGVTRSDRGGYGDGADRLSGY